MGQCLISVQFAILFKIMYKRCNIRSFGEDSIFWRWGCKLDQRLDQCGSQLHGKVDKNGWTRQTNARNTHLKLFTTKSLLPWLKTVEPDTFGGHWKLLHLFFFDIHLKVFCVFHWIYRPLVSILDLHSFVRYFLFDQGCLFVRSWAYTWLTIRQMLIRQC